MSDVALRPFHPSDAAWIIRIHGALYTTDEGFDDSFEPLVNDVVTRFASQHDPDRERAWVAQAAAERIGCLFCFRHSVAAAQIRLFLVLPDWRGTGLGRQLLHKCMGFAADKGYEKLLVWTFAEHRAAAALYQKTGFSLASSHQTHAFGRDLTAQNWEIPLVQTTLP